MNKRSVGTHKEQKAEEFLTERGVRIIKRNYRNRQGEIDLIGIDGEYLVFFEVKYRKNNRQGYPEDAVSFHKQKNICKVADYYRVMEHIKTDRSIRYDVVAIEGEEIRWIQNAFWHYTKR